MRGGIPMGTHNALGSRGRFRASKRAMRLLVIGIVALLVASIGNMIFLPGAQVARATTTRNVLASCGGALPPICYTSISAAVAASLPGDVVSVHAGVFTESSTLNITVPITLQGAGAGVSTLAGDLNDPMIVVTLTTPGALTISGLTIQGNGRQHDLCNEEFIQVHSALATDTISISDNAFLESAATDPSHDTCLTEAYSNNDTLSASVSFTNNSFVGFTAALEPFNQYGTFTVTGNDIEGLDPAWMVPVGIEEYYCCATTTLTAAHRYANNTFGGYAGNGIDILANYVNLTALTLTGNTFRLGGTGTYPAVTVGGFETGGKVRVTATANVFALSGSATGIEIGQTVSGTIQSNHLVGGAGVKSTGVHVLTGTRYGATLYVTNNLITGFEVGLSVEPDASPSGHFSQSVEASQNCIQANTRYGAINTTTIAVNAASNWWGAASGPFEPIGNPGGTGNAVNSAITYRPFLAASPTCP